MSTPPKQMIFRYATINYMCGSYLSYLLGMLNDYFYTKSSDMLNKNTLGVKKVRGQEEAAL